MARANPMATSLRGLVDRVVHVLAAHARPLHMVAIVGLPVRPANAARVVMAPVQARAKVAPRGRRVRTGIPGMRPAFRPTMPIPAASTLMRIVRVARARPALAPAATALVVLSPVATVHSMPMAPAVHARVAEIEVLEAAVAVAGLKVATAEAYRKGAPAPFCFRGHCALFCL